MDELEHHVVGQQDVRWARDDSLAIGVRFLPGESRERDRATAIGVAGAEKLPELHLLRVREGVHRVHDDRLDAPVRTLTQHPIHDRDDCSRATSLSRSRS
jgi:hypothetical protein